MPGTPRPPATTMNATMKAAVASGKPSCGAAITYASRAATRAREPMLLPEAELLDEALQRGHLAAHPAGEVRGALVGVRAEVPLLGELLPLGRLHRLLERVGQHLHAVGRRALPGDHAAELGQRDVEPQLLRRGHVREGGMAPLREDDQRAELPGLQVLEHVAGLLVDHLGVPAERRRVPLARL